MVLYGTADLTFMLSPPNTVTDNNGIKIPVTFNPETAVHSSINEEGSAPFLYPRGELIKLFSPEDQETIRQVLLAILTGIPEEGNINTTKTAPLKFPLPYELARRILPCFYTNG